MPKQLTDAEKVAALTTAIQQADRTLNWLLEPVTSSVGRFASGRRPSEWAMTTARSVRRILRNALRRVADKTNKADKTNEKAVRLDIVAMKANGILKEAKRK